MKMEGILNICSYLLREIEMRNNAKYSMQYQRPQGMNVNMKKSIMVNYDSHSVDGKKEYSMSGDSK